MKTKHYLITGGTGFIGSAITKSLLQQGQRVTVFDDNSRNIERENNILKKKFKQNILFIKGDIRNKSQVKKAIDGKDAVIHLAYINGTKSFYLIPEIILEVAVKGIINVLDSCKEKKIDEIYLASSSEVYHHPKKIPTNENVELIIPDPFNPRFSYGGGKIISELLGIHYGKKYFKKLIIFRPHNVFGPNMGHEHVIPELIKKIIKINKSKILKIQGTGKETRSFIYIDDFVSAFNLILKKGKNLNIYNIGNQTEIKIIDLVKKIIKIMNADIVLKKGNLKKGGTSRRCPDITKIKKLGYLQKTSLNLGIKQTIEWYSKFYEKK